MKKAKLYDLKPGQVFKMYPEGGYLKFVKVDGVYAAITNRMVENLDDLDWNTDISWLMCGEEVYIDEEKSKD